MYLVPCEILHLVNLFKYASTKVFNKKNTRIVTRLWIMSDHKANSIVNILLLTYLSVTPGTPWFAEKET